MAMKLSKVLQLFPGIFSEGMAFLYSDVLRLKEEFKFTAEDAKKDWTRFLHGAYVVDNRSLMGIYFNKILKKNYCYDSRPRVLCCWISGEGAKYIETLAITSIKLGVMKTIRKFVNQISLKIPDPLNIHVRIYRF